MAKGMKTGGGSRKNVPNIRTQLARDAIAKLVDDNAPRMQAWLDAIAKEHGPLRAWECLVGVIEYHVPKLARTEVTGADGGAVATRIEIVAVAADK